MKIREIRVHIRNIMDIHRFVKLASKYEIDADVHAINNGRHVVPIDSILGIFSLDLMQDLRIVFVSNNEEDIFQFVKECEVSGWIVE